MLHLRIQLAQCIEFDARHFRDKPQSTERLIELFRQWIAAHHTQRLAIDAQRVLQQMCQLGVAVLTLYTIGSVAIHTYN
jgi:hypothetical protein